MRSFGHRPQLFILFGCGGLLCLLVVAFLWLRFAPSEFPRHYLNADTEEKTTRLSLDVAPASASLPVTPNKVERAPLALFLAAQGNERELRRFWEEAMAGTNQEKLETALQVIERPGHPYRAEAFRILQLFLGADMGVNATIWRQAILEKLEKQKIDAQKIRDKLKIHQSESL